MSTTFSVAGMTCEHCVRSVAEEVSEVPGVASVAVDLASGRVVVEGDGVDPIDPNAIAAAVDEAGYSLVP